MDQITLTTLLRYEPETGHFYWREPGRGRKMDRPAGKRDSYGYCVIVISGRQYKAHRLAWLYVYGEWPEHDIDHIDRNPSNNKIHNLRCATRSENMANRAKFRGQYEHMGVVRSPGGSKWRAIVNVNGKARYLGTFTTQEDAHAAYIAAHRKHFGEFSPF